LNGDKSIQEVPLLIYNDVSNDKKIGFRIKHYSFMDKWKDKCYNYLNFIDTAKPIKSFNNIDSVSRAGGWNFYSKELFEYKSCNNLLDTTIDSVKYGRIKVDKNVNGTEFYFIMYFRYDKKGQQIRFFRNLSDRIGYPIVRDDTFIKDKLFMTRKINFISDTLSAEVTEVFNEWEKNELN